MWCGMRCGLDDCQPRLPDETYELTCKTNLPKDLHSPYVFFSPLRTVKVERSVGCVAPCVPTLLFLCYLTLNIGGKGPFYTAVVRFQLHSHLFMVVVAVFSQWRHWECKQDHISIW